MAKKENIKTALQIADEDVIVKMSLCRKCKGWVRVAIEHMMDEKETQAFFKESAVHKLDVKNMPLLKYREDKTKHCSC